MNHKNTTRRNTNTPNQSNNQLQAAQPILRRTPTGSPPKGYTRSDERIREDICDRIMQTINLDASDVSIRVESGEVTLEGNIPDRYSKLDLEEMVANVSGVSEINNQIRIRGRIAGDAAKNESLTNRHEIQSESSERDDEDKPKTISSTDRAEKKWAAQKSQSNK